MAPQTYNDARYLFDDAAGSGSGWVDQAWEAYGLPIWFTEIGQNRKNDDHVGIVTRQLKGVLDYSSRHPGRLIVACFFQFADKVWMQGTSEGSFGAFMHGPGILCSIHYGREDFTHWEANCDDTLHVDILEKTDLYSAVKSAYRG